MIRLIIFLFIIGYSAAALSVAPLTLKDNYPELDDVGQNTSLTEMKAGEESYSLNSNDASVLYTYSQSGFQQKGQGQNYDTQSAAGKGLYASYARSLASENEVNFKLWINQATFTEPSSIGGKDVGVQRALLSSVYTWQFVKASHTWQINLGTTALSQNPDKFSNSEKLVPHYLAFGPTLGGGYKFKINSAWNLKSNFGLTFPAFFKEYGANSGYHSLSWHYLASLLAEAKLNRSLSLTFGVLVEGEEHSFDGEGERGVQNAKVSFLSLAIPLGVSYAF
jgi:hypothetical protein